jgi:hypothetical protein
MKLRIDSKQIRFRINHDEAQKLIKDQKITETLLLANNQTLSYSIIISEKMHLNLDKSHLVLAVALEQIKDLIQNPTKNGLSASHHERSKDIQFTLQIDIPCEVNC